MESNFVKGVRIIEKVTGCLDYFAEHDIIYFNSIDGFDAYQINELFDLGFYIDEDNECFMRYT